METPNSEAKPNPYNLLRNKNLTLISIGIVVVIIVVGGVLFFVIKSRQKSLKNYTNPFAQQKTTTYQNPFVKPTTSYQNPFSSQSSQQTNQPYQNPFGGNK